MLREAVSEGEEGRRGPEVVGVGIRRRLRGHHVGVERHLRPDGEAIASAEKRSSTRGPGVEGRNLIRHGIHLDGKLGSQGGTESGEQKKIRDTSAL